MLSLNGSRYFDLTILTFKRGHYSKTSLQTYIYYLPYDVECQNGLAAVGYQSGGPSTDKESRRKSSVDISATKFRVCF